MVRLPIMGRICRDDRTIWGRRLSSELDGVREHSEEDKANRRAAVNRADATGGGGRGRGQRMRG